MTITLRPVSDDDLDFLWHWSHGVPDAEWKQWDAPYFHADDAAPTREEFDSDQRRRLGSADRRIVLDDGRPVGIVTRYEEDPEGSGWWELGIVLHDPASWGGGRGGEALCQWTDLTFAETDAHVITLTTWGGNERMVRCGQRAGYVECARIPEARVVDGRRYDSVKLALLRRDHVV